MWGPRIEAYDIVYSPNKYRETEGIKDLKRISSFSAARQIEAENRAYNELGHIGHHMSELHEKGELTNA